MRILIQEGQKQEKKLEEIKRERQVLQDWYLDSYESNNEKEVLK